jgi:hypothetical protein
MTIKELIQNNTTKHGPFDVLGGEIPTGVYVHSDDIVITESTGTIKFSRTLGPIRDADGEDTVTPDHYPARHLKKHSLICKVGFKWYQGGKLRFFIPLKDGKIFLRTNDDNTSDNSGKFVVFLYHIKKPDTELLNALKDEADKLLSEDLDRKTGLSSTQQLRMGEVIVSSLFDSFVK